MKALAIIVVVLLFSISLGADGECNRWLLPEDQRYQCEILVDYPSDPARFTYLPRTIEEGLKFRCWHSLYCVWCRAECMPGNKLVYEGWERGFERLKEELWTLNKAHVEIATSVGPNGTTWNGFRLSCPQGKILKGQDFYECFNGTRGQITARCQSATGIQGELAATSQPYDNFTAPVPPESITDAFPPNTEPSIWDQKSVFIPLVTSLFVLSLIISIVLFLATQRKLRNMSLKYDLVFRTLNHLHFINDKERLYSNTSTKVSGSTGDRKWGEVSSTMIEEQGMYEVPKIFIGGDREGEKESEVVYEECGEPMRASAQYLELLDK